VLSSGREGFLEWSPLLPPAGSPGVVGFPCEKNKKKQKKLSFWIGFGDALFSNDFFNEHLRDMNMNET